MLGRRSASRQMMLLVASALGLHSLRYLLAPVSDPAGLADRHAYLSWLGPLIAAGLAAVLGDALARMARARADEQRAGLSTRAATLTAAAALLAVFVAQESLESLLSGSGLSALTVALGGGGWVIVPLALGLGAMIALLTRGGTVFVVTATAPRPRLHRDASAPIAPRPIFIATGPPLGRHLAGRAPPIACEV